MVCLCIFLLLIKLTNWVVVPKAGDDENKNPGNVAGGLKA